MKSTFDVPSKLANYIFLFVFQEMSFFDKLCRWNVSFSRPVGLIWSKSSPQAHKQIEAGNALGKPTKILQIHRQKGLCFDVGTLHVRCTKIWYLLLFAFPFWATPLKKDNFGVHCRDPHFPKSDQLFNYKMVWSGSDWVLLTYLHYWRNWSEDCVLCVCLGYSWGTCI